MTNVDRIARIVLHTADVERLAAFYVETLEFAVISANDQDTTLDLGSTQLVLRRVTSCERVDAPGWSPWFQHCAIAVSDMDAAMDRLQRSGGWSAISTAGPETLPPNTGSVTAFKFRDPDGHPLEFLDLHEQTAGGPFLRIDHTAISVVDVARSVAFYESFGLVVGQRSVNRGVEQERLDAIAQAVVDAVPMQTRAGKSPHLELLAYRGSFDRPTAQLDRDAIASTCIVFEVEGPATVPSMRDPDGHFLAFRERNK